MVQKEIKKSCTGSYVFNERDKGITQKYMIQIKKCFNYAANPYTTI